ncbi:MAG: hypothetical protein HOO93_00895 [Methyloglobulus sp.]|nr:hypothetical protein [Methyloglobulus sp.]
MKLLILPAFAILLIANAQAQAAVEKEKACTVNDMNGRWVSYQGAVLGNPHTGICKFKVANGLAQGECDFSVGFKGPFTGEIVVNPDCSADFAMDFNPASVVSDFQVQLHKDKKSFVGRWSNNFGVIGVTNAVKR